VEFTDGRLSGSNKDWVVAHISPEAAGGGLLAVVADGDVVEIDLKKKSINLVVPSQEIDDRPSKWNPPTKCVKKGIFSVYKNLTRSASEGAGLVY
jgi:dihydroxy-acid dehydratase